LRQQFVRFATEGFAHSEVSLNLFISAKKYISKVLENLSVVIGQIVAHTLNCSRNVPVNPNKLLPNFPSSGTYNYFFHQRQAFGYLQN
jgi:hypothetical protein